MTDVLSTDYRRMTLMALAVLMEMAWSRGSGLGDMCYRWW